jgi:fatty acid desaturase
MHPTRSTAPGPPRSGYGDLVVQVRDRGLLRPRPSFYVLLGAANLMALVVVVTLMVVLHDSWWLILLAPAFAAVSGQLGFFSHDAAHHQIARSTRAVTVLCLLHGNLLNGLSFGWWTAKHNAHHAHPNDLDTDPDVAVGAFVFDSDQAAARRGVGALLTRHQAGLFFPMLFLEAFNLRISSIRAVLRPGLRNRALESVLLVGHLAAYTTLLVLTMSWTQAVVFVVVHQGLFGLYLGSSFAPSHKGMPVLSPDQAADPLLRQVLTSRNIRGGPLLTFALGGLNLQIEHHLFPSMPRCNLRRTQPLVREHCRLRGIAYAETTLLGSYRIALRHLHDVGAPLRHDAQD